jgi:hypothetical protein
MDFSRYWMLDTRCSILDAGCSMLDARYYILDTGTEGHSAYGAGRKAKGGCFRVAGCSMQVVRYLLLDDGNFWLAPDYRKDKE